MGTQRENTELANSTEATGGHWNVIVPGKRMSEQILAETGLGATWIATKDVDVWKSSRVYIYATIGADVVSAQVSFVPELSGGKTPAEDEFIPLFDAEDIGEVDLPSSPSSEYVGTNFNSKVIRPQEFRSAVADGAGTIKLGFFVDVLGARKLRIKTRALAGNPTIEIKAFKVA